MTRNSAVSLLAITILIAGCGTDGAESDELSSPQSTGKADGLDSPDHGCHIVLREASMTSCSRGICMFTAAVDVSRDVVAQGAGIGLLMTYDAKTWRELAMSPAKNPAGVPAGLVRYLVSSRRGEKSAGRGPFRVIPFYRLANGSRVFDHNRLPGNLDMYSITSTSPVRADATCTVAPITTVADRSCHVVLREASMTSCSRGACDFRAVVDVTTDAINQGAQAGLLTTYDTANWQELALVSAESIPSWQSPPPPPPAGFRRFVFSQTLSERGPSGQAPFRLIPFYRLPNGQRVFDHNRLPGDLDIYSVTPQASVTAAPGVCGG